MSLSTHKSHFSLRGDWRLVPILMICILISLSGWLRMTSTLSSYSYLIEIGLYPHPVYLIVMGAVIGLLFLTVILFLWLHKIWALTYVRWGCAGYLALLFIENRFLSSTAGRYGNAASLALPTMLGMGLLLLSWPSRGKGSHYEQ